jgi:hypothetical protein
MKYRLGDFTVKHWNDWDRVPRDPFILFGGNILAAPTAAQIFLAKAISYVAVSLVTSWALKALAPKLTSGQRGLLFNAREAAAAQEIVYGKVRKGGYVTFAETTGSKNKYLHQIITLAGHEVNLIDTVFINDEEIQLAAASSPQAVEVIQGEQGYVYGDRWSDSDGNRKIYIHKFLGADNQNIASVLRQLETTSNIETPDFEIDGVAPASPYNDFKGEGIACLYVRLEYDTNVFSDGIPLITAEVEGKKVYDPRDSSTSYSANAALCVRDYITSTYGLDNDGDTDDAASASFDVAADVCDETVNLAATDAGSFIVGKDYTIKTVGTTDFTAIGASANTVGVTFTATGVGSGTGTAVRGSSLTENRYEINGVISLDRSPSDILGDMMTACAGTLFWGAGLWHLKVGDYVSPVKTFTLDDLRSEINLQTKHSRRDNFNIVRGTFVDAENRYLQADYPEIRSETFISDDSDVESALDLALPLTTSSAMAQRLAKMTLFRGREQMTFTADFSLEAFEVECGDIIALTIDRYGWSSKEFEVVGWKFKNDGDAGDLRVALTLRETSSAAFSWSAEESEITSNGSTLPDPRASLGITNLAVTTPQNTNIATDGTHTVTATLTWDAPDNVFLTHYLVGYKNNTTGIFNKSTTDTNSFETGFLVDGDSYTFVVAAVTDSGYVGTQADVTFTADADTVAPAVPTSVSGSGGYRSNFISWTNPTDDDLKEIQVYVNTSNTSTGATLLGTTSATEFVHGGLAQSTTRYYFLKAVDFTGNASDFSTGTGAVTTEADPQDGVDGTNGTNGTDGADGDTGDTVISGRVYYQTIQSSAPSTPSATSYNVSTASFSGLTSGWALTQPQIDITDTSIKEWSSAFTVTIDGVTSAQTIVFTTPTGAIQVAADLESDNYVANTSGWKIERDTGFAEFGSAAIRGTLTASQIQIDNVTLDSDGSGNLIIASGGVDTAQLAANSVTKAGTTGQAAFSLTAGSTKDVTASITNCDSGSELLILFNYLAASATAGDEIDLSILKNGSVATGIGAVQNLDVQDFTPLACGYMMRVTADTGTNTVGVRITADSGNTSTVVGLVYGLFALEIKK